MEGSTSDGSKWTSGGAPGTTGSVGGTTAEATGVPASGRAGADAAPEAATCVCAQPSTPRDHSTSQRADLIFPPVKFRAPPGNRPRPFADHHSRITCGGIALVSRGSALQRVLGDGVDGTEAV